MDTFNPWMLIEPKLVVVVGLPGSGKTTLVRRIEKSLEDLRQNVVVIDEPGLGRTQDELLEELEDASRRVMTLGTWVLRTVSLGSREVDEATQRVVYRLLPWALRESTRHTILLEVAQVGGQHVVRAIRIHGVVPGASVRSDLLFPLAPTA